MDSSFLTHSGVQYGLWWFEGQFSAQLLRDPPPSSSGSTFVLKRKGERKLQATIINSLSFRHRLFRSPLVTFFGMEPYPDASGDGECCSYLGPSDASTGWSS